MATDCLRSGCRRPLGAACDDSMQFAASTQRFITVESVQRTYGTNWWQVVTNPFLTPG
jgi:hypothetical protein